MSDIITNFRKNEMFSILVFTDDYLYMEITKSDIPIILMFVENGCQSAKISGKILQYFDHFKCLKQCRIPVSKCI